MHIERTLLDSTSAAEKSSSGAGFISGQLGDTHEAISSALSGEAQTAGGALAGSRDDDAFQLPRHVQAHANFGKAWALARDYRTRYGSPSWRRAVGKRSARQGAFVRMIIGKIGGVT